MDTLSPDIACIAPYHNFLRTDKSPQHPNATVLHWQASASRVLLHHLGNEQANKGIISALAVMQAGEATPVGQRQPAVGAAAVWRWETRSIRTSLPHHLCHSVVGTPQGTQMGTGVGILHT